MKPVLGGGDLRRGLNSLNSDTGVGEPYISNSENGILWQNSVPILVLWKEQFSLICIILNFEKESGICPYLFVYILLETKCIYCKFWTQKFVIWNRWFIEITFGFDTKEIQVSVGNFYKWEAVTSGKRLFLNTKGQNTI